MTNTFKQLIRFIEIVSIFVLIIVKSQGQITITGATCTNPNSSATYTISGSWTSSTFMTWTAVNGTITTPISGTPRPQATVTWGTGTKSISIRTTNPTANYTLNVSSGATFVGGTISNSPFINYNTIPPPINCTSASGGACSPIYTYQWQQSSTSGGTYTNISGATSQNLTLTTAITSTTYYKRLVTETTTSQTIPSTNYSTVTVYPVISPGAITPNPLTINSGTSPGQLTGSLPTGGNGIYTYQWQQSPDGLSWTSISGATSQNYTPGSLTSTEYFNRIVYSNGASATTPNDKITVVVPSFGVTAPDNSTGNANTDFNWVETTGYDPSGNILAQQKQFYDKSAALIQTQWKEFYRANSTTVYTHVFASQPLKDAYGRQVLTTMGAPINYTDFSYSPNFMQNVSSNNYSYKDFDRYQPTTTETDNTNSPIAVGGQVTKGTLGWYYGPNNNWEPYLSTSNYPYARSTIYRDGTNEAKKQAGVGEAYKMGANHETSSYIFSASGELANYLLVRNKFFTTAQVGALPPSLQNQVLESSTKDQNGSEWFTISDRNNRVLMTARPGTDLIVNNSISLASPPSTYSQQVNCVSGTGISIQSITGGNNIIVYFISTTGVITSVYSGVVTGIPINTNLGSGNIIILSDIGFSVNYTSSSALYSTSSLTDQGGSIPSVGYFKILANATPVTISGSYTLYDMNAETVTSLNAGTLSTGFYKIEANSGIVNVSYANGFTDVSYFFYDQSGQLIAKVPPNGVKLLENNGYNSFASLSVIPYIKLYTYDTRGRLISTSNPDGGTKQYVYRNDGKIRFTQDALQVTSGSFTYENYDQLGRPIESGQYVPGTGGITFSNVASILENVSSTGGLTNGTQTDVVKVVYDIPDASHNQPYIQDPSNLSGAISTTMRYSSIVNNSPLSTNLVSQTWYNYDEEGKMVWKIKYIALLGSSGYKTTDYYYDNMSRLVKKIFQKNTSTETFVHYFQYDPANGNLSQIYTNTIDDINSWTLQANYIYYLHGGIKRVELAGNVQGTDYTYTLDGKLKAINNSNNITNFTDPGQDAVGINGFNPDAFGEVLDYYSGDYNNARSGTQPINGVASGGITTDSWVGNIKSMTWYSNKGILGPSAPSTYLFTYGPKYEFLGSTWGNNLNFNNTPATFTTTNLNHENIIPGSSTPAYDANGNIQNLQRTDPNGVLTDQFAYNYISGTNKLSNILNGPTGSQVTYAIYNYDVTGKETSEVLGTPSLNKYYQYDRFGRVILISQDAGFNNVLVRFVYDEAGKRIEKLSYNSSYQLNSVTYYYGDVIYTQTVSAGPIYGPLTASEYQISGMGRKLGIYDKIGNSYDYELVDHLGNVRAIITKTGTTIQVNKAIDYYPFGSVINTFGSINYRYGYQGQYSELDGETSLNNFDTRMYNSRIGRWSVMDSKGQFASPYIGMGNDPGNRVDPDGAFSYWEALLYQSLYGGDIVFTGLSYNVNNLTYDANGIINGTSTAGAFAKNGFGSTWGSFAATRINSNNKDVTIPYLMFPFRLNGNFINSTPAGHNLIVSARGYGGYATKSGSGIIAVNYTVDHGKLSSIGMGLDFDDKFQISPNIDLENLGYFIDIGIGNWDGMIGNTIKNTETVGHSYTSDKGVIDGANYDFTLPIFGSPQAVPEYVPVPFIK